MLNYANDMSNYAKKKKIYYRNYYNNFLHVTTNLCSIPATWLSDVSGEAAGPFSSWDLPGGLTKPGHEDPVPELSAEGASS